MTNEYNLGDIVKIKKYKEEYRIVGMNYNTFNKPKEIWYHLYRLSDGYTCVVADTALSEENKKNEV